MAHLQLKKWFGQARVLAALIVFAFVFGCVSTSSDPVVTSPAESSSQTGQEPAESSDGRIIESVKIFENNDTIDVDVRGNRKLVYTSIKQSFPFGIGIYFPETRFDENLSIDTSGIEDIKDIKISYADEEQTTSKIEIILARDLDYTVEDTESSLMFQVQKQIVTRDTPKIAASSKAPDSSSDTQSGNMLNEQTSEPLIIPDTTATLNDIEFTTTQNGSDIHIVTSHPIRYSITQDNARKNQLFLNLEKTVIPEYHQRPIITTYFKSAVERILPIARNSADGDAMIKIELRDQVPYHIVQNRDGIFMTFDATSTQPPVFAKAKKTLVEGETTEIQGSDEGNAGTASENEKSEAEQLADQVFGAPKQYTGEKIRLDFFETDIKNVFRILRSVSGKNFAIDKDVTGKVTMTLDDPVPWDQVLDLVLKMNDLGKIEEGNVIRIATSATLAKESSHKQELLLAKQKELAQQKELEPLVTEYIPINYSDAESEIQPHITKILTEERGILSVDKRNNMLIMTDTKEKIRQAKQMIKRLDKVTPQIMIEAKVVEVSDDFSRKLGVGLSLRRGQTPLLNNKPDFTVALNAEPGEEAAWNFGSFNLNRILGSTVSWLNAEISAAEIKGDLKIVSSPRILTIDNKKAMIKQGLEIPYVLEVVEDGTVTRTVQFKNVDLLLEVTPHVTPDERISMSLHLTKNDIDSIVQGVPSISTNEAETELLINNNDTIIIGGIVKKSITTRDSGTPYLMDVPVLGRLFKTESVSDKRNELLIFITPKIVQLEQRQKLAQD